MILIKILYIPIWLFNRNMNELHLIDSNYIKHVFEKSIKGMRKEKEKKLSLLFGIHFH